MNARGKFFYNIELRLSKFALQLKLLNSLFDIILNIQSSQIV